jgi:hypothetical protein
MDAARFDCATRALAGTDRRRVLGGLLGLLGLLGLMLDSSSASSAAGKDRKRRNGRQGGETCQDTRRPGEACEQTCQCKDQYRCGAPRPTPAERGACGQNLQAKAVCCREEGGQLWHEFLRVLRLVELRHRPVREALGEPSN